MRGENAVFKQVVVGLFEERCSECSGFHFELVDLVFREAASLLQGFYRLPTWAQ